MLTFDLDTLYELHYHMITLGKVFCRKQLPNCVACPLQVRYAMRCPACTLRILPLPCNHASDDLERSFLMPITFQPSPRPLKQLRKALRLDLDMVLPTRPCNLTQ